MAIAAGGYLVHLDVDRIQDYVLTSPRLRDIRSASAALDRLTSREHLEKRRPAGGRIVRAGAGSIYLILEGEDDCRRFVAALRRDLREVGATATAAAAPISAAGFAAAQYEVNTRVRRQKDAGTEAAEPVLSAPILQPCSVCGRRPAAQQSQIGDDTRYLCVPCTGRASDERDRHPLFERVRHDPAWEMAHACKDLDELARLGGTRYLALVHADGNQMGEAIKQALEHGRPDAERAYSHFSEVVDAAVKDAVQAALQAVWPDGPPAAGAGGETRVPCEPIIYGGDDLALLVPAPGAFHFAVRLLESFAEQTERELGRPITMSGGVVIAHESFPVVALNRLGHDLEDSAKVLSRHLGGTGAGPATLDFLVLSQPSGDPLRVMRNGQTLASRAQLFARPYTVEGLRRLLAAADLVRGAKIPSGRLHELYQDLHRGPDESDLLYRQALGRMTPEHREALQQALASLGVSGDSLWIEDKPTGVLRTPLADLVEIYPFAQDPARALAGDGF